VSKKKSFIEKLNDFIFGRPAPGPSRLELKTLQQVNRKLDALLQALQAQETSPAPAGTSPAANGRPDAAAYQELAEQVRKLAKTQFKANTLQESQLAQQQEVVANLQRSLEQQGQRLAELSQQQQLALEQAQLEVINSLLPVIDSLENAFETGRRQVLKLSMPDPSRRAMISWLDGIRLARLRMLDILQEYHVTPIPTVGHPFDPNRHVAVATDASRRAADGLIIGEDRRGYATPDKVLRFAEVVVARSNES